MGWTSYNATYYRNGTVDRKAECDAHFMEGLNKGHFNVKKSAMRGSVYYAAVEPLVRYAGRDEQGNSIYEDVPENERETWAAVFLTSVNMRDYYNFAYKDMSEDMGPYDSQCPLSILNLLSPTENKYANEWRERCRANAKTKNTLGKLPVGTTIEFEQAGEVRRAVKMAPAYQFKTPWWYLPDKNVYLPKTRLPKEYKIIEQEAA